MYQGGPNPSKVQVTPAYKRANPPPPLVLIHDGGGTTFGYFVLGNLGREVWAIHNPNYWSGEAFEGGMDGMATKYIEYMYKEGIKGTIMLGGWSLGGYLSLAVANMLAKDPDAKIKIAGIIMMDTPYHVPRAQLTDAVDDPEIPGIPEQVQKAFDRCDEMLEHWEVPKYDAPACDGKTVFFGVGGRRYTVTPGHTLYKPVGGTWRPIDTTPYKPTEAVDKPISPPPTVLIKCVKSMPLPAGREENFLIDKYRDERLLGWEDKYPDFIKAVIDFDSDHYNMFDKDNNDSMKKLTGNLTEALEILGSIGGAGRAPAAGRSLDFF
ncbi:putative thioesterase TR09 [Cladobotryum mycophilum]|uniref:Thioesterase TR09 n=1 Tax=Cladobotryum mycophilum TaxID=491253 RepID=A0ABR0S9W3_9HYPO